MADLKTDYLIIGNSAAGVTAAEHIRANDEAAHVTIASREPYPAYGRPLISYMIEGKTTEEKIWFKAPDFYEEHRFDTLFGPEYEVIELTPEAHETRMANGQVVAYGKCLLATGSIPFTPPIKGLEGKANVSTFITLDDAKTAWSMAKQATEAAHAQGRESRIVVIGAGSSATKRCKRACPTCTWRATSCR